MSNWLATCVLNAAWQITAITLVTLIGERLLRRGPSRYVHAAWVVALAACLFVPAMTILMQARDAQRITADARVQSGEAMDASRFIKGGVPFSFYSRSRSVLFPPTLIRLLLWTYAALVLFRGTQLAWIGYRTSRIRKQAFACTIPLSLSRAAERCRQVFCTRPVPILCTAIAAGPATIGTIRPILVLPETFFNGSLEEPDLICALSHEFAHIRRHDFLMNLACELMYVLVCFHPCAALIMARIAQTRELACDEMAARMCLSAGHYARSLLQIAQTILSGRRQKLNYGLGLFDTNTLEERVMNILSTTKTNWQWTRTKQWMAACLVAAVCLGLSAFSLRVYAGSSPAGLERFVGTWQAKYNGMVFFNFNIHSANGLLGGSCTHTDRLAYVDGELIPTGDKMSTEKIVEAQVSGQQLLIKVANDPSDPIPFEFRLTGNGQAEVRVPLASSSGAPAPKKPWHFERVSASQ